MSKAVHIAFAWEWGTGAGHLSRFEALASELVLDGHKITLIVRDLTLARKVFPLERWCDSVAVRQAPTPIEPPAAMRQRPTTFAELAWNLGYHDADRVLASIEAWRGVLRDNRCHGVIADFGIGAVVAARSLGIPAIRIGTGFECPPPSSPLANLRLPNEGNRQAAIETLQAVRQHVDSALQAIPGTKADCSYQSSIETVPQIVATVPELEHYRCPRPDANYIGMWKSAGHPPASIDLKAERTCFAYLKTSPHVEPLLSAIAMRNYQIVLSGPASTMTFGNGLINSKVHRCPRLIQIETLQSRISFGITNANHGTTFQLLCLGIPVLSVPLFVEQFVTSYNLQTHGLGVSPTDTSEPMVQTALDKITDDQLSKQCRLFAERHGDKLTTSRSQAMDQLRDWIESDF